MGQGTKTARCHGSCLRAPNASAGTQLWPLGRAGDEAPGFDVAKGWPEVAACLMKFVWESTVIYMGINYGMVFYSY